MQQQVAVSGEQNPRALLPSLPEVNQEIFLTVGVAWETLQRRKVAFELGIKLKREGKHLGTKAERDDADLWMRTKHLLEPLLVKLDKLYKGSIQLAPVVLTGAPFSLPQVPGKMFFPFRFKDDGETFCLCNNNFQGFEGANPGTPSAVN